MKKLLTFATLFAAVTFMSCSNDYDDSALKGRVDNLENRVAKLEELCKQMNTNISSLQTIVTALQNNDYVTNVIPVMQSGKEIGYTIVFSKGNPITIYHGKDGHDGVDGTNGKDGITPIIGVKQDTDGIYYWTLNGEWLTDVSGGKIKAEGTDGKDGIAPQLKIESGYWYLSYDAGKTWTQLEKAIGADGNDGDSMFKSVTQDSSIVYFTLADGTVLSVPKTAAQSIVEKIKSITFIPRYSDGKVGMTRIVGEDNGLAEFDFKISPKAAAEELAKDWNKTVTMKAVYTKTRAVEFIDLPIVNFKADTQNGVITLKVSGENLNDDYFLGNIMASAALSISDGDNSVNSDYIPMLANNGRCVIYYTTTLNLAISTDIESHPDFVSNTYSNGQGVIVFKNQNITIPYKAFVGCSTLESITIPGSVIAIGESAFEDCRNLKKAFIGNSISSIGDRAFYKCALLADFTIPESVVSIGESAFNGCSSLTSIRIPNKVTLIEKSAFSGCSGLTSITMPESVTVIGWSAFSGCSSLTSIAIPENVTTIGGYAFSGCDKLVNIVIPKNITSIEEYTFNGCGSLASIIIPNGVSSIGHAAFCNCRSLTNITLPKSITEIGPMAFYLCSNLTSIYCESIDPPILKINSDSYSDPFHDIASNAKFYVPTASLDKYKSADVWRNYYAPQIVGYDF